MESWLCIIVINSTSMQNFVTFGANGTIQFWKASQILLLCSLLFQLGHYWQDYRAEIMLDNEDLFRQKLPAEWLDMNTEREAWAWEEPFTYPTPFLCIAFHIFSFCLSVREVWSDLNLHPATSNVPRAWNIFLAPGKDTDWESYQCDPEQRHT